MHVPLTQKVNRIVRKMVRLELNGRHCATVNLNEMALANVIANGGLYNPQPCCEIREDTRLSRLT
jgi:hypothetical protein